MLGSRRWPQALEVSRLSGPTDGAGRRRIRGGDRKPLSAHLNFESRPTALDAGDTDERPQGCNLCLEAVDRADGRELNSSFLHLR